MSPIVGDVTGNTQAVYAFDTVKLGERVQLNGGLRWERFDVDGVNTTGAPLDRVDTMLSVRAGAVYKPAQNGSIYVSMERRSIRRSKGSPISRPARRSSPKKHTPSKAAPSGMCSMAGCC